MIELNLRLTNLGTGVCPDNTKLADFDCRIKSFVNQKASMSPDDQIYLGRIESEYAVLVADAATLGAIAKDLGNYLVNIHELGAHPATANPGEIVDPVATNSVSGIVAKLLGRQVVYAVNVLNGVANLTASAPAASQRKSIATITVLFADPVLEASAGTFFSFLPSRTFTNQTLVAGGNTPGMTVIAQSLTRPNVVPFAAANVRLGPDFLIGNRRGALYATAAIGINTNTTTTEFAFGPSLSWRALMFSAFYHVGQDVRLTQNEQVGMPWPAGSTPPTPSTERFWTGAFAVGISVRVPSVFTGK